MENLTSSQREDVRLVCEQAHVDQQTAIDRLQKDDWDLVNAILNLDEDFQKELSETATTKLKRLDRTGCRATWMNN